MKRRILCALISILLAIWLFPIGSVAVGEAVQLSSWADLVTLSATETSLQYDSTSNSCTLLSGSFEIADTFEIPSSGSLKIENGVALSVSGQLLASGTLTAENGGTLTIDGGTLTITSAVSITGSGSELVNNGMIFVMSGSLIVDAYSQGDASQRVAMNGGTVTGIDGAYVISDEGLGLYLVEGGVTSEAELIAALEAATNPDTPINLTGSVELTASLTIAENISVSISGSLTIPADKTLTVRGVLSIENGILLNNGNIVNPGTINVGGEFQNNGVYLLQGQGSVILENGGSITGTNANAVTRLKGDVNGDGYIRNDDVKCILNYRIGDDVLDLEQLPYGDLDGMNGVDLIDALMLSKILPEGEWSHVYP